MTNLGEAVVKEAKKHKPDDVWRGLFNWELLGGFARSKLATASIAMPFIGYAILYHSELAAYFGDLGGLLASQEVAQSGGDLASSGLSGRGMSFYTKLNLVYLGAFFIGIGTIAFRVFAPSAVKEAGTISRFVEIELGRSTARKLRSMMIAVKTRRPSVATGLIDIAPWLERDHCSLKLASNELRGLKDDQLKIDVLSSFYNVENRYYYRFAVYFIFWFYFFGFLFISIPGALFTLRVLRVVIADIFRWLSV